jgi:hypothetical protein
LSNPGSPSRLSFWFWLASLNARLLTECQFVELLIAARRILNTAPSALFDKLGFNGTFSVEEFELPASEERTQTSSGWQMGNGRELSAADKFWFRQERVKV